jgi:hypothetical protein
MSRMRVWAAIVSAAAWTIAVGCGSSSAPQQPLPDSGTGEASVPRDSSVLDAADATTTEAGSDAPAADGAADGPADGPADGASEGAADGPADSADSAAADAPVDGASDAPIDGASDAPATDAPSDALQPEAGEAGSPSLCNNPAFVFCDGFEDGLTNWTQPFTSGGATFVDNVHVYRGQKALHAQVAPVMEAGTTTYAAEQKFQAWPLDSFTRFFAYVPSPMAPSQAGLISIDQNGGNNPGIELLLDPSTAALTMETFNTGVDGGDQTWHSATAQSALDQWVCFEIEVNVDTQTTHVYMNDVEVTDLMRGNLLLPPLGITGVGVFFFRANPQSAQDVWIDEVAVSAARVGCTN